MHHDKIVSHAIDDEWAAPGTVYKLYQSAPGDIAIAYSEADCDPESMQLSFQNHWLGFRPGDQEGSVRRFRSRAPKSFRIVKSGGGQSLHFSYSASLLNSYIHSGSTCYNNELVKFPFAGLI